MTRKRTKGNFLFQLYYNAPVQTQLILKARLLECSPQHWENFLRTQTAENKKSGFDAEIIGICALTLIDDVLIQNDTQKSDITKLSCFWAKKQNYLQTA